MLLSKAVKISVRSNNKKYLESKGYDVSVDEVFISVEDLPKNSRFEVLVKCDFCGSEKTIKYLNYLKSVQKWGLYTCSGKCSNSKRKLTNLEKFGTEWASSNENIKNKIKSTNLDRWGVECVIHNKEIKKKITDNNIEKWGTPYPSQNEEVKLKTEITNIKKWGEKTPLLNEEIKGKIKKSLLDRWGVDNPSKNPKIVQKRVKSFNNSPKKDKIYEKLKDLFSDSEWANSVLLKTKSSNLKKWGNEYYSNTQEFKERVKDTLISKYGTTGFNSLPEFREKSEITRNSNLIKKYSKKLGDGYEIISLEGGIFTIKEGSDVFKIHLNNLRDRIYSFTEVSTIKNPLYHGNKSGYEIQIGDFVKSLGFNIILGSKKIINPQEIDIFIPDKNLAIEFNGLYWHSEIFKDRNYHIRKLESCKNLGINLISIFEDDWIYKKDIVKSIIMNKLGVIKHKIWARNCKIEEIYDVNLVREFLENNHIQGFSPSDTKLGLFHEGSLVSLMTFGHKWTTGSKKLELSRFCSKINTVVIGGADRLFKYFLQKYSPKEIVSYSDISIFSGELYQKLGFNRIGLSRPNYYWVVGGRRHHRFKFNKRSLVREGFDPEMTEVEIMYNRGYYRIWGCGQMSWEYIK